LVWLALIGVLTSVVSGYYYLRVVYLMYMHDGEGEVVAMPGVSLAVGITAIATIILGFFPGAWFAITREAALLGARLVAGG
jgi:NADH-quinone oxidoreductase subunit N